MSCPVACGASIVNKEGGAKTRMPNICCVLRGRGGNGLERCTHDTTEANMACRGIHRLWATRCRAIAATIVWRAQVRASLQDLSRDADRRQRGIAALDCGGERTTATATCRELGR